MHVITIIKRGLRPVFRPIMNSFLRTIGRFIAWFLLMLVIGLIFGSKVNAEEYTALDTAMNSNYLETFKTHNKNIPFLDDYVAFSYSCSYINNNYERTTTCYYYCHGSNLKVNGDKISGRCQYYNYHVIDSNTLYLDKGIDENFSVTGKNLYSSLGDNLSFERSLSDFETCILLAIGFIFISWIIYIMFNY